MLPSQGRMSWCRPWPCSWSPSLSPSRSGWPRRSCCTGGWWQAASCHKTLNHLQGSRDDSELDWLLSSDPGMIEASQGARYNNPGTGIWTPGIQKEDHQHDTSYFPSQQLENLKVTSNDEKICDKANTINISVNKQTQMTFVGVWHRGRS